LTGIRPGFDPTDIQWPGCPKTGPEKCGCVDTKSSQGLLRDMGRKESRDILYIYLKKFWPLRLDVLTANKRKNTCRVFREYMKVMKDWRRLFHARQKELQLSEV